MAAVARALGERCQRDVPIGPRTTYHVGGPAALLFEAESLADLRRLSEVLAGHPIPVAVLGRGSNLLVADAGFPGLVLTLAGEEFNRIEILDGGGPAPSGVVVRAGGAVALPVLARQTAAAGLTGMEWGVGIPGSVGGAVRMNAGGHGADTAGRMVGCRLFDLAGGSSADRHGPDLGFGYRRSGVAAHQVVVRADYRLEPGAREASEATIRDIQRWRREHQPGGQNAGSVFVNPPGSSAGWLVESVGLKGARRGSAMVSPKHANFIQADPDGSADDVVALMLEVQRQVAAETAVLLKAEVRLLGFSKLSTSTLT